MKTEKIPKHYTTKNRKIKKSGEIFKLNSITPHDINICMNVVKKDKVVHGMLQDELERCEGLSKSLAKAISRLPKGSLHERKIPSGKKRLPYNFLKYRDGDRSVYKHVPKLAVIEVSARIEERRKLEGELRKINARIKYLRKLLNKGFD